ncbi:MAG: type II secretion system protein [Nanoarchaeota archaeon]
MNNKSGFTLLEVLVVIGILSVFLLSAVTVSIVSVRNLKNSENKILASRYAEGLIEWLRGEKEADWDDLKTNRLGIWCFKDEPIIDWPSSQSPLGCQNQKINNLLFQRKASISVSDTDPNRLLVEVNISWNEGEEIITIPVNTLFEQYD